MLEFVILMVVIDLISKIPSKREYPSPEVKEDDAWDFKSVDDCFEFREMRKAGWRGNAVDFYKLKEYNTMV